MLVQVVSAHGGFLLQSTARFDFLFVLYLVLISLVIHYVKLFERRVAACDMPTNFILVSTSVVSWLRFLSRAALHTWVVFGKITA